MMTIEIINSFIAENTYRLQARCGKVASPSSQSVYDMRGRRLNEEPAHGVIIKDRRKVIKT